MPGSWEKGQLCLFSFWCQKNYLPLILRYFPKGRVVFEFESSKSQIVIEYSLFKNENRKPKFWASWKKNPPHPTTQIQCQYFSISFIFTLFNFFSVSYWSCFIFNFVFCFSHLVFILHNKEQAINPTVMLYTYVTISVYISVYPSNYQSTCLSLPGTKCTIILIAFMSA